MRLRGKQTPEGWGWIYWDSDSRPAVPSCADPSLSGTELKSACRHLPLRGSRTKARTALCHPLRPAGGQAAALLGDRGLLSLPGEKAAPLLIKPGCPHRGTTCMDAPWPRSSAGFSFQMIPILSTAPTFQSRPDPPCTPSERISPSSTSSQESTGSSKLRTRQD